MEREKRGGGGKRRREGKEGEGGGRRRKEEEEGGGGRGRRGRREGEGGRAEGVDMVSCCSHQAVHSSCSIVLQGPIDVAVEHSQLWVYHRSLPQPTLPSPAVYGKEANLCEEHSDIT